MSDKIEKEIEQLAESLEKAGALAGEGVRGGQIMGHTPTGQPIYESNLQAQKQWREQHKKPSAKIKKNESPEDKEEGKEKVKKSEGELTMEVKDTLKGILARINELGPDGLKKAAALLTPEQNALLNKILTKALSMDKEAVKKPKNVKDLNSHEIPKQEGGIDEEDEKLVKPEADSHRAQGDNSPEGIEGQVIKSEKPAVQGDQKAYGGKDASSNYVEKSEDEVEMPKKKFKEEHKKLVEVLESPSREDDKEEAKKQKKELKEEMNKPEKEDKKMKKSEVLEEIYKSDEKLSELCSKCMSKGMKKEKFLEKASEMGWDVKKCDMAWSRSEKAAQKPMKKSIEWNDWTADAFGIGAKRGRNFHVSGNDVEIEKQETSTKETLKKGEYLNEFTHEVFAKSDNKKVSINDLIEKSLDRDSCTVEEIYQHVTGKKAPKTAVLTKSFDDSEIEAALGIDSKKAEEILGKK
jgi:hypothetical protein